MKATFVSVWDGGTVISTSCDFDPETRDVTDIDSVDVDGLDILDRQYVELPDGTEIEFFTIEGELPDDLDIPTREIEIKIDGEKEIHTISHSDVSDFLLSDDPKKTYRFPEAEGIDEGIFFFVDIADWGKSDKELAKIIEESL